MENRLYKFLHKIVEEIGERLPSSDGERKTANFIINKLKEFGLEPIVQNFKTPKSPYEIFQFVYFVQFLISISFFNFNIYLKIFLIAIQLFIAYFFYREFTFQHTFLFPFFQSFYSKNIIVKFNSNKKSKERIIITAHIDSATASFLFNKRIVKYLPHQIKFTMFSFVFIFLISIISLYYSNWVIKFLYKFFSIFFGIGFIVSFYSEYIAKPTKGANDNGSSVAILLGLAESFSNAKMSDKEVWLVFTGAEEAGCIGIYEFLKSYKEELKDKDIKTYFITLDCTGVGIPTIVRSEGMLKRYKSSQFLLNRIEETASRAGIKYQVKDLPVGYTEMEVAINFGFEAITIGAAFENPKEVPNWHQESDRIEFVNSKTLYNIYKILESYIKS